MYRHCFTGALSMAVAMSLAAQTAMAQRYELAEIATLPGSSGNTGTGINDRGQVTGYASFMRNGSKTYYRAFLYSSGIIKDLGTLGGAGSSAYAVNASGEVTGSALLADNVTTHAFVYSDGVMRDIGTLGGNHSAGYGINASGQVTGDSLLADNVTTHAFLYTAGSLQDIGTLRGGTGSSGRAINANGQVTGYSGVGSGFPTYAFLYTGGVLQDLGTVTNFLTSAGTAINASGEVVGTLGNSSPHSSGAFLYTGAGLQPILATTIDAAAGINEAGDIVGTRAVSPVNAVLPGIAIYVSGGKVVDLQTLIDPSSPLAPYVTLSDATGISGNGNIVANGIDSRHPSVPATFVLTLAH